MLEESPEAILFLVISSFSHTHFISFARQDDLPWSSLTDLTGRELTVPYFGKWNCSLRDLSDEWNLTGVENSVVTLVYIFWTVFSPPLFTYES